MEQGYWLRRKHEELAMAWKSTNAEARIIHFDLAGRYSVKACDAEEAVPPPTVPILIQLAAENGQSYTKVASEPG